MENVLKVEKLTKNYGRIEAVKEISFNVHKGEVFGLIGPNGAGKSTTLKMISTLLSPSSGKIDLNNFDVVKNPDNVRELISYLPEEAGAYKNMKGKEYLQFMAELYSSNNEKIKEYFENGVKISNLGERLNDKISTYSKGMTRKLLLARTVMVNPVLAILDEPTSGLDILNGMEIRKIIRGLAKEGMSVLLSSHNMLEVEFLSDRVAIIDKGRIHDEGTAKELKEKYKASNLEEVFEEAVK